MSMMTSDMVVFFIDVIITKSGKRKKNETSYSKFDDEVICIHLIVIGTVV